jgi:hypothetical protein
VVSYVLRRSVRFSITGLPTKVDVVHNGTYPPPAEDQRVSHDPKMKMAMVGLHVV